MLEWNHLSWRHRLTGCFFSAFALVGMLAPMATAMFSLQEMLGGIAVGAVMLGILLNPASFKNPAALFDWSTMPLICKWLVGAAFAAMVGRAILSPWA